MKLHFKKREEGSSLFVAMTICLVVGVILAGYLVLTSNRFTMTVRSSDWNAAIPVLEAGIEEALTHLSRDTNSVTANNWTTTTLKGISAYTKSRTFSDGSYYNAYIVNYTSNSASIYSQGFVRSPYNANKYISRLVLISATNPPITFTHAIAVSGSVSFVGHPVVDAYDSRKGGYDVNTNRDALGSVVTNLKTTGGISLGGANIYGRVSTGPGGTATGGTVGDIAWNKTGSGIEPGWSDDTMNVAYPTNSPPTGGPYVPPTSPYTNILSGTYQMSSYTSSGDMIINGKVVLYVTGDFTIKGNNTIQINPGGSLTIIAGGNVTMNGNGVLNGTGVAANFSIVGLTSCTSVSYGGTAQFIGTINAPQADFTIKGTIDAYGAVIAKTAYMNGNTAFHYDESLGAQNGFLATTWQEL